MFSKLCILLAAQQTYSFNIFASLVNLKFITFEPCLVANQIACWHLPHLPLLHQSLNPRTKKKKGKCFSIFPFVCLFVPVLVFKLQSSVGKLLNSFVAAFVIDGLSFFHCLSASMFVYLLAPKLCKYNLKIVFVAFSVFGYLFWFPCLFVFTYVYLFSSFKALLDTQCNIYWRLEIGE